MIATYHPLRHFCQAAVSIAHLYGDLLYYTTFLFDHYLLNVSYSRPEAVYFWGYSVCMNAFWTIILAILLYNSVTASSRAFAALEREEKRLIASGAAKKTA